MNKYTMVMDYTTLSYNFLFSPAPEQPLFCDCWDRLVNNETLIGNFMHHFDAVLHLKKGSYDPALRSLGYTPEDWTDVAFNINEYVYNAVESSEGLKFDALKVSGESHHVEITWEKTCYGDGLFGEGPYYSYFYNNVVVVEDRPVETDFRSVLHEDFNRRFIEKEFYAVTRP